jgi:hypothetical protein
MEGWSFVIEDETISLFSNQPDPQHEGVWPLLSGLQHALSIEWVEEEMKSSLLYALSTCMRPQQRIPKINKY